MLCQGFGWSRSRASSRASMSARHPSSRDRAVADRFADAARVTLGDAEARREAVAPDGELEAELAEPEAELAESEAALAGAGPSLPAGPPVSGEAHPMTIEATTATVLPTRSGPVRALISGRRVDRFSSEARFGGGRGITDRSKDGSSGLLVDGNRLAEAPIGLGERSSGVRVRPQPRSRQADLVGPT